MFMYLHKNKKGFTLIELMVVVAIIGILALLGLRVYATQQDKAKFAIVKANAGTVQTIIQSNMADKDYTAAATAVTDIGTDFAGMKNPFGGTTVVVAGAGTDPGVVYVTLSTENGTNDFTIKGYGKTSTDVIELRAYK